MQISAKTLATVEALQAKGEYAAAYAAVIADLNAQNLILTSDEQDVMHWLNTAEAVNSGSFTFNAIAIRAINQAAVQYELGKSINLFGLEEQEASNQVADTFISNLGNKNGTLPDIHDLIKADAGAGVAALGVSPAGHAAAVPDGLSQAFTGFSNDKYYDELTPAEQQEANILHINALAMMAGYVATTSADDSVAQKNAVTNNISSYLASLSQNPVIAGIESAMAAGTGTAFTAVSQLISNIQTVVTDIANNVAVGLGAVQDNLNTLFGSSILSATGLDQIMIAPGAVLDDSSSDPTITFAPVNGRSGVITFNADGSLSFSSGGADVLNAPTGTTVSNVDGDLLFQMPSSEGSWLFNPTTGLLSSDTGGSPLSFFLSMRNSSNSFWGTTFSAPKTGSPIVLDLTGNGIQTTLESAGTYFDLRNTGFAEKTGWVSPQDGLLVWDRNGNGVIDNGSELFGNYTPMANGVLASNGFAALVSYDTNHDGVINASDPIWNNLQVWIDSNGNGVTDPGELHSLSSLGIQSLNLNDTDMGAAVTDAAGNNPEFVSSFTYANGATAAMTDVNFVNDTSQTVATSWVATTAAIDALPDLQEQGTVYSLHQAMARDTTGTLQALVTQFTTETTIASRNATMEQILIDWAGAQNVDPASRNSNGGNFNAQHLAVLEAFMGRAYYQQGLLNPGDPNSYSAPQLASDYFFLFERMYAELAAQTFLKPFYNEIATVTDANGTHFNFSAALADLFGNTRTASVQHDDVVEFYRTIFASGIVDAQVNYAGLLSSLAASAPQYVTEVNQIVAPYYAYDLTSGVTDPHVHNYDLYVGNGGSTIVGGLGGSTIYANYNMFENVNGNNTTVYGNAGTNTIYADGHYGVDRIYGGTGNDTIYDGGVLLAGTIIDGGAGNNTLILSNGTDISQATVSRIQTLEMDYATVAMTAAQLSGFSSLVDNSAYSEIDATTAGTYSLATQTATGTFNLSARGTSANITLIGSNQDGQTLTAGNGNDTLTGGNGKKDILQGGAGTDTLTAGNGTGDILYAGSGNSTLTAGTGGDTLYDNSGVDTLNGGTGNDTFYISIGKAGTTVKGNGGNDTLLAQTGDITGMSISQVQTLQVGGSYLCLTAGQFSAFSNLVNGYLANGYSGTDTLYAMTAGTYNVATKTATGPFNLDASHTSANVTLIGNNQNGQTLTGGTGADTLTAGNGKGDILYAGTGNSTLTAGTGGDTLYDNSSVDTLNGGTGNDTFYIGAGKAGTTVKGNGGSDTLIAQTGDITGMSISQVQTLQVGGSYLCLTAGQFSAFSNLVNGYLANGYSGTDTLYAMTAGTYNMATRTATGPFNLDASHTSANVTLIGNNQNGQTLTGGTGADTLTAGNGKGDILYAGTGNTTLTAGTGGDTLYDNASVDTLNGGTGNDTFYIGAGKAGTTVKGNGGSDILIAQISDITGMSISQVQTLQVGGSYLCLTAGQFSAFSNLVNGYQVNGYSGTDTLYAMTAGTYNMATRTATGPFNLDASHTSTNVTLIGNNQNGQTLTGGAGADTLTAGNGAGDILYGGSGTTTMNAGTGNDTFDGGSSYNTYKFGTVFGQDVINNAYSGAAKANGEIDFASGITDEKLWFKKSGNDLLIELLGTKDQVDVAGWFGGNAGAQVQEITAGGLKLDTQVAQLVNAMASYGAAHSSFNPTTATSMPTDSTLQAAIAAAWHH